MKLFYEKKTLARNAVLKRKEKRHVNDESPFSSVCIYNTFFVVLISVCLVWKTNTSIIKNENNNFDDKNFCVLDYYSLAVCCC